MLLTNNESTFIKLQTSPTANMLVQKNVISSHIRLRSQGSPDYVPPDERIAVFDNDGRLGSDEPANWIVTLYSTVPAKNGELKTCDIIKFSSTG